jgi:hypothetical protein
VYTHIPYRELAGLSDRLLDTYVDVVRKQQEARDD